MMQEISRDRSKLEYYVVTDPGTTTCFAALFVALNPYTRKVYILDEIYETDQQYTSVSEMYPRIYSKTQELYPGSDFEEDWMKCYDEAAAWFANEVMQQYGIYFIPTDKRHNKKENGLSLIKDQLIHDLIVVSDRCEKWWWEHEQYAKDDKGNLPKRNDHLIDCTRYFNGIAHYSMVEVMEALKVKRDGDDLKAGRFRRFGDEDLEPEDWMSKIFTDFD